MAFWVVRVCAGSPLIEATILEKLTLEPCGIWCYSYEKSSGSAVVLLICSMEKAEDTPAMSARPISFL